MIEITGFAGTIALLAPVLILAVVIFRAMRGAKKMEQAPEVPYEVGQTAPLGIAASGVFRDVAAQDVVTPELAPALPPVALTPEPEQQPAVAPPPPPPVPINWPERIASAANDNELLARNHLAYARDEIAGGRSKNATEQLLACLRLAARLRNRPLEAQARLELAELARETGDLTSACEHWQIARAIFHDVHDTAQLEATEASMFRHGCPTDWVLNDF